MAIETEKKYRLTKEQADDLRARLQEINAAFEGTEFEENTLYAGGALDTTTSILRLRRTNRRAVLTFKRRGESKAGVKQHVEEETEASDGEALAAILEELQFTPALVYEKRRATWEMNTAKGAVEVVIDELPFGWYAEIEGTREAILAAEKILNLSETEVELLTYPNLVVQNGARNGARLESRFAPRQ
jgi:predicted adenylyl cyclase CyaB